MAKTNWQIAYEELKAAGQEQEDKIRVLEEELAKWRTGHRPAAHGHSAEKKVDHDKQTK